MLRGHMKHFLLKFNHGVEIGAYLAYIGHFKRTNEARMVGTETNEACVWPICSKKILT